MKYVLLFIGFVLIAQIDSVVKLFETANDTVVAQKNRIKEPVSSAPIRSNSEVVSVSDDPTLKLSAHGKVIALMDTFRQLPDQGLRKKIMEEIKLAPKMLTPTSDPALESAVFGLRDNLANQNQATIDLAMDFENLLQGENQIMIRKFMTILFDAHLETFIKYYQRSRDVNCKASILFIDGVAEDEKINELRERDEALTGFLAREGLDPQTKTFASLCQLVVRSQMTPVQAPVPVGAPGVAPEDGDKAPAAIPAPVNSLPINQGPSGAPAAPVIP